MRTGPDPGRHTLHHKSLAVLEEIRSLLEAYGRSRINGCLKLEINIHHGVPSRLTQCRETRKDIPLESQR